MARPKRSEQITDLQTAIKDTAWEQIAKHGAAALSLRAIARQLEITAPAIYNYYPSRDDLVTALIKDAYSSFGEAQWAAVLAVPEEDHIGRFTGLGLAYRDWAIRFPQRYQLIFGTPIPGYQAPLEEVMPIAARALEALIEILAAAKTAGVLQEFNLEDFSPALRRMLVKVAMPHPQSNPEILYLAVTIWAQAHGLVSLEIGNQYPPYLNDLGEVYRVEIKRIVAEIFIRLSPEVNSARA
jgi:AcrR family transcriptional regulator